MLVSNPVFCNKELYQDSYFYSLNSSRNVPPTDRIKRIQKQYGNDTNNKSGKQKSKPSSAVNEKKRIRQMLLDGEISEETYRELMDEL